MKNIPLYKLEISSDNDGVFAISVVNKPAIQSDFVLLNKEEVKVKFSIKEDQRIITGPVLIPDIYILREDENGNYYNIYADAETIKQAAIKFFAEGYQNNATLEHKHAVQGITFFESWIITDLNNDKSFSLGLKNPLNTWMASGYVKDDVLWEKIKAGDFNGFSIEAFFNKELVSQTKLNKINNMEETFLQKFKKLLLDDESSKFSDVKLSDGSIIRIDASTKSVNTIGTDGKLTALKDGDYKQADGTKLSVFDGKVKAEEAPAEVKPTEVKAEVVDLVLKDGTVVTVDMETKSIVTKDGKALPDGHYVLDSGEEFDVANGLVAIEKPMPGDEFKILASKIKLGLIKIDKMNKEFKLSATLNVDLAKKVTELESKIKELENKTVSTRADLSNVKEDTKNMSYSERVMYGIKLSKTIK